MLEQGTVDELQSTPLVAPNTPEKACSLPIPWHSAVKATSNNSFEATGAEQSKVYMKLLL